MGLTQPIGVIEKPGMQRLNGVEYRIRRLRDEPAYVSIPSYSKNGRRQTKWAGHKLRH